jgi:hypothetical protein
MYRRNRNSSMAPAIHQIRRFYSSGSSVISKFPSCPPGALHLHWLYSNRPDPYYHERHLVACERERERTLARRGNTSGKKSCAFSFDTTLCCHVASLLEFQSDEGSNTCTFVPPVIHRCPTAPHSSIILEEHSFTMNVEIATAFATGPCVVTFTPPSYDSGRKPTASIYAG